jgi:type IV pilus assembly protein PilA
VPALAQANAGIGYFTLAVPLVLVALAPAVFIEAGVIQFVLKTAYRRALSLSWWANLRSTLWGVGLGLAGDVVLVTLTGSPGPEPTRSFALVMLVPFFLLSWWIEARAIDRLAPGTAPRKVLLATGAANAITYAAMAAGAAAIYPAEGSYHLRPQISEALLAGSSVRTLVAEFWQTHDRFPKDAAELGLPDTSASRFRVNLQPEGRIEIRIHLDNDKLRGKRLTLTPRVLDGKAGTLEWTCRSPDIEPRFLPSSCRSP